MTRTKIILNWISLISIILLMVAMCSCSASWHLRRAQKKDPSLFQDTLTSITAKDLLPVSIATPELNDCIDRDITWVLPRAWEYKGDSVKDTITVTLRTNLSHQDSLDIYSALEVDCDPVIIEEQLPPILLEPTLKDNIGHVFIGFGVGVVLAVLLTLLALRRR